MKTINASARTRIVLDRSSSCSAGYRTFLKRLSRRQDRRLGDAALRAEDCFAAYRALQQDAAAMKRPTLKIVSSTAAANHNQPRHHGDGTGPGRRVIAINGTVCASVDIAAMRLAA